MRKVDIPNIDGKVWNRKSDSPQRNFLRSLTQPEIKIQRPFKLTDIDFDIIKDEIITMERVEYSTAIGVKSNECW